MEIKKEYEKLAKKYALPSYEKIDFEFEISCIESDGFLLRKIREKIVEKIETYLHVLEGVLKPEVSLCDLYECKVFEDSEKEGLLEIYKELMYLNRYSIELSVDEDDLKLSKFIKEVFEKWPDLKKRIAIFLKKLKESWLQDIDVKSDVGYLG